MAYPVITIGREYGSGGRQVGKRVAEALSIPFYDKELIDLAAKQTGFTEKFVQDMEQKRTSSLLYSIYSGTQSLSLGDQIYVAQTKIIRDVAQEPCVIVGRCADYILRGTNLLRVFLHAPMEERIARVRDEYKISAKDYESYIIKTDKNRASYYNYFTNQRWGRCQHYDLTLNTSLGIDMAVSMILDAAKKIDQITE